MSDQVECPDGCIPANFERHKLSAQRVLDELQACIILSGGSKISIKELAQMSLAEVMFMCFPNDISIKVFLNKLPHAGYI